MEKLLIVDDEEWILEGLKMQLPWSELGIKLTDTALNGQEAWEILKKEKPEIVLTDIRMPVMDGLELAQKIYMEKLDCEMIIVSGYSDFEYAQKAIAYGVSAYLTKPIIREELEHVIQKVLEKIRDKRNKRIEVQNLKEAEKHRELSQLYLMEGEPQTSTAEKRKYLMGVFYAASLKNKNREQEEADKHFLHIASGYFRNQKNCVFFRNHFNPDQYILMLEFEQSCDNEKAMESMKRILQRLLVRVSKEMKIEGIAGISHLYESTEQSFHAYLEAKFIVENLQGDETCRVIDADEFENTYGRVRIQYEEIERLLMAVECREREKVESIYRKIKREWEQKPDALIYMRMNVQEIIISLSKLLTRYGESMYEIGHEYVDFFRKIWYINSVSELAELSKILIDAVMEHLDAVDGGGEESVVEQIRKYVDGHYSDNITLNEVSKKFYINPTYLSRAFKKQNGVNFNDYVRQLRMKKAGDFLRMTDLKVYEIAYKVGFDNANYFMKKFQEYYGVTPGKYREQFEKK